MISIALPISAIVPHAGSMSLLSRAIEGDDVSIVVEADIRHDHLFHGNLFYGGNGVGAWIGIEYMAQAIAAWAGWRNRLQGEAPVIGFLLGTRRYECNRPQFFAGETLRIEATRVFWGENGLGQFDCRILIGDETVAAAALTVFSPAESL